MAVAAAIAAPIIGGLIGRAQSGSDRDAAMNAYQNAANQISSLDIPDVQKQELMLQLPQVMGQLNYNMETVQQLAPSAMQNVSTDPRLAQAQMSALQSLAEQGNNPLQFAEKAELNAARRGASQEQEAANQAILQNMQARGMGGAGQELAAKLAASQGASDRMSQESDRTMAMAQNRALQAIAGAGQLGGQVRAQEFGEQSAKAQAADAIAKFNAANAQSVQQRNVATQNAQQQQNLAEQQRVHENQVALRNAEQQHNKALIQQDFENRYRRAGGTASGQQQLGNALAGQAAQTGAMWTGVGSGVGAGIAALNKPDEDKKKDATEL